jgi:RimJ/RimL family protein N-acetyltransferase
VATPAQPSWPLTTPRLRLRPHRLEDLDDLVVFHSDPEVVRHTPWPVRDREQTRATLEVKTSQDRLAPGQWLVLAIERRDTATVIGEVLLKWASEADRQGEIGFALRADQQGQGLAREAAEAVLELGFGHLGLHRITAVCIAENLDSVRLLERLGMRLEGELHHSVHFKGAWANQRLYALTEDEWRPR